MCLRSICVIAYNRFLMHAHQFGTSNMHSLSVVIQKTTGQLWYMQLTCKQWIVLEFISHCLSINTSKELACSEVCFTILSTDQLNLHKSTVLCNLNHGHGPNLPPSSLPQASKVPMGEPHKPEENSIDWRKA